MKNGDVAHLKRRKQNPAPVGLVEPVRKTMYDILVDNLKSANRATFLHRIIYVGYHRYYKVRQDQIVDCFSKIISTVNEAYCIERLTGLLVYYNRHFIHLVEGDEDSINNHLELLLKDEEFEEYFGTVKLLIHVSHISKRFMTDWNYLRGYPTKLVGQIDMRTVHDYSMNVLVCLRKIYASLALYRREVYGVATEDEWSTGKDGGTLDLDVELGTRKSHTQEPERKLSFISDQPSLDPNKLSLSVFAAKTSYFSASVSSLTVLNDPYRLYLPEEKLLDAIICSLYSQEIAKYHQLYFNVPQRDIYKDRVWPVPASFIPFDVFERPFDPVVDLPRFKRTRKSAVDLMRWDNADAEDAAKEEK